jgi:hypothetical protein
LLALGLSAEALLSCSLYQNILKPGKLEAKADLYLFMEGVKPDWDEQETQAGGLWTASIPKTAPNGKQLLDEWWLDSVRPRMHTLRNRTQVLMRKRCSRWVRASLLRLHTCTAATFIAWCACVHPDDLVGVRLFDQKLLQTIRQALGCITDRSDTISNSQQVSAICVRESSAPNSAGRRWC